MRVRFFVGFIIMLSVVLFSIDGYYAAHPCTEKPHAEITVSTKLPIHLEKPATSIKYTVYPQRFIFSSPLLKELFLQQQIQHKLSILSILREIHLTQKISSDYYTLGLGVMRC